MTKEPPKKVDAIKNVYRNFIRTFVVISAIMFLLLTMLFAAETTHRARSSLIGIQDAIASKYEQAQISMRVKMDLIAVDYVNRAKTIGYILVRNPELMEDSANIATIKELMNVEKINVADSKGIIIRSANPEAIGEDLRDHALTEEFLNLALNRGIQSPVVSLGKYDEAGIRAKDYAIVPVHAKNIGAVEITFYAESVDEAQSYASMSNMVKTFVTEYDTILTVMNEDCEITCISENNDQRIDVAGVASVGEVEKKKGILEKAKNGSWIIMNGRPAFMMSREYDTEEKPFYVTAFFDMSGTLREFAMFATGIAAIIVASMLVVISLLWRYNQKYIVDDFRKIQEDIDAFVNGDEEREIRPCTNEAMESLNESVRRMREGYRHKSERLNKIISAMGSNIAAFECLPYTSALFVSDNMQSVLGVSDAHMAELTQSIKTFTDFVRALNSNKNAESMVQYHDRWLKIVYHHIEHEHFGLIVDKTEEYTKEQMTLAELHEAQRSAARDQLTGLFSRNGFVDRINEVLTEDETVEGVMLIFDMDNFKSINDHLGHPEGDHALQMMAGILRRNFRKSDIIGRLGGDEFVVFMPNAISRPLLEHKLALLLKDARETFMIYERYKVTVSIGVALSGPGLNTYKTLYEAADTALYMAKELGKNQFYINYDGIRCMEKTCKHCRVDCPRRRILHLE